jgi:hypothetical protein
MLVRRKALWIVKGTRVAGVCKGAYDGAQLLGMAVLNSASRL